MIFTELSINPYILFSRLKTLADETTDAAALVLLASDLKRVAKMVEDDLNREAMLAIVEDILPPTAKSEGVK